MSVPFIKTLPSTLISHLATTLLPVTTSVLGENVDITGFMTGVFVTNVIANGSASPAVYLDVSVDKGTNFVQYATLHPDMTTTANLNLINVANMPNTVRVRVQPSTTSTNMRFTVKANIFAK